MSASSCGRRPAPRRLGDLERGMAALGRKGEMPDDMPILKRAMFDSDRDWFEAQLGFYASQGLGADGPTAAAGRPLSAETGVEAPEQPVAGAAPAGLLPQVVYHGTNRPFGQFELRSSFRQDSYGRKFEVQPQAHFFSESPETARMFAEDRSGARRRKAVARPRSAASLMSARTGSACSSPSTWWSIRMEALGLPPRQTGSRAFIYGDIQTAELVARARICDSLEHDYAWRPPIRSSPSAPIISATAESRARSPSSSTRSTADRAAADALRACAGRRRQ
jgi:hypothetical protein